MSDTFLSLTVSVVDILLEFGHNRTVAAPQDPFYCALGKRIKVARVARRLTQEQLARSLQLTRTSITNIEAGKQPVAAHHLAALCRSLGVSADALLSSSDITPMPQLEAKIRDLPIDDAKREWVKRIVKNDTPNS